MSQSPKYRLAVLLSFILSVFLSSLGHIIHSGNELSEEILNFFWLFAVVVAAAAAGKKDIALFCLRLHLLDVTS